MAEVVAGIRNFLATALLSKVGSGLGDDGVNH